MPRKKKRPRADASGADGSRGAGDAGGSGGDGGAAATLPLNTEFAKRYDFQKRRELLASVPPEALEGSGESSSNEEEEDELAELLTRRVDKGIADTLDALRRRDPKIYDKGFRAFGDEDEDEDDEEGDSGGKKAGEEEKLKASRGGQGGDSASASEGESESEDLDSGDEPVAGWDAIAEKAKEAAEGGKTTLKDYVRENLLRDGRLSDSEDEQRFERKEGRRRAHDTRQVTFQENEENEENDDDGNDGDDDDDNDDDDDEEDGGDFFKKKEKTQEELAEEEKDFERFLSKKTATVAPKAGDELLLHSYLERESKDEKDMFLRDFVLNNGWLNRGGGPAPGANDYKIEIDNADLSKKIPKVKLPEGEDAIVDAAAEDSDDFEDKVDEFEHKYNFRFEEPGGTEVVSHARTIEGSMRRPDERRKAAREARRKRKQHEKLVKTEEIKHLKNVKKREIEARLLALEEAAGDGADFTGFDLDADFDPDDFSRQMESRFGDEYYEKEDGDMQELGKEEVVVASEKRLKPKLGGRGNDGEDNERASDGDAPLREDVERLMDEYYSLDYEDIIGGTPVRFKYKKVDKETFSMDPAEILDADDKDLNRALSLKYLAPYRAPSSIPRRALKKHAKQMIKRAKRGEQQYDGKRSRPGGDAGVSGEREKEKEKERSRKKREKRKHAEKGDKEPRDGADESSEKKKRKRKREALEDMPQIDGSVDVGEAAGLGGEPSKGKQSGKGKGGKKRRTKGRSDKTGSSLPPTRLAAYGLE